jgi:type I restriction enzyme, S subunit
VSFLCYTAYKSSGVEWLGDVPDHWETKRIRTLFEVKKRIAGTDGFNVLSITQQGIRIKETESNVGQNSMDYSKYQLAEVGEFAMNHMDLLT